MYSWNYYLVVYEIQQRVGDDAALLLSHQTEGHQQLQRFFLLVQLNVLYVVFKEEFVSKTHKEYLSHTHARTFTHTHSRTCTHAHAHTLTHAHDSRASGHTHIFMHTYPIVVAVKHWTPFARGNSNLFAAAGTQVHIFMLCACACFNYADRQALSFLLFVYTCERGTHHQLT